MAISLPDTVVITDYDEQQPCHFCGDEKDADPDDMDGWRDHLKETHGYRVHSDLPRDGIQPRKIELNLAGWSKKAKFQPNDRVTVNDEAPGDYAGRRGTVIGWRSATSEYVVAFDQHPTRGWLDSGWLERYPTP